MRLDTKTAMTEVFQEDGIKEELYTEFIKELKKRDINILEVSEEID